jgi:hypothetical protein
VLRSVTPDHQNNNIPKSAILALSFCIRPLLESTVISKAFNASIMDIVFDLYFLLARQALNGYATVLRACIALAEHTGAGRTKRIEKP